LSVVVSDFLNPLLCVYVAVHTFLFQAFNHSSLVSRHSPWRQLSHRLSTPSLANAYHWTL